MSAVLDFLPCRTPQAWLDRARDDLPTLLIDHAHCEKKAASTALTLLYRYPNYPEMLQKMSRLAREELRHFEQVLKILENRGVIYRHLSPSRYAGGLLKQVREAEPFRLVDTLIMGAFIEARSCERFASLLPQLAPDLAKFYQGLLASEARHFEGYLKLAEKVSPETISGRISDFSTIEADLILSPDPQFRFHSGI